MRKNDYKNLIIWQKSMDMTDMVYDIADTLPYKERGGLYHQMTSAAVSVPSNIAEGQRRFSNKEFIHHLKFSLGSAAELETQLIICFRRKFIDEKTLNNVLTVLEEINGGIVSLINSIQKMINGSKPPLNPKP